MKYQELIDLGFKRTDVVDKVHFERTGNTYFYLNYELCNGVNAEWDPDEEGSPVSIAFPEDTTHQVRIYDLALLDKLLILFTKREK